MTRYTRDESEDPIETLRTYLESKLSESDMGRVNRLLDALADKAAGRSGAQDSDIQRRLRVSRQRMAEDASAAAADVHARFPGMSRIRVG
jgi:hypothetical protein